MSNEPVERRALKVASVTMLSSASAIIMQILTVAVCVKYWGNEKYGIWLTLFSTFATLQTAGASYVAYIGNKLNIAYHGDRQELQRTLGSAFAGVAALGLLLALLLGFLIWGSIVSDLVGAPAPNSAGANSEIALWILFVSWLLGGFYLGIIHRLVIPTGLMYQAAWWWLGSQTSLSLAVILAALAGADLQHTSLAYGLVQLSAGFSQAWYIRRKVPQFFPWWRGFSVARGLRDLGRSTPQMASGLVQQGAVNGLVILVSAIAGAPLVPTFTTVRTIANLWTNVTNLLTSPLLPDIVRFHARAEGKKLFVLYEIHAVAIGTAINLSILFVYPFIPYFYHQWTHHSLALDTELLCALLGTVSLFNLSSLMSTLLMGINHQPAILSTTIARGAIAFALGAYLLRHFGLAGLGLAIWTAELVALLLYVYYFMTSIRRGGGGPITWRRLLFPILGVVGLHLYLCAEAFGWPARGLVYWVALLLIGTGGYLGWRRLPSDIRVRLRQLIMFRMGKAA